MDEEMRYGIAGGIMVPHPPLIIPEVGRGEEREIQATVAAYERAAQFAVSLQPDTYIISSPHTILYADYFHISPGVEAEGDFGRFRAGNVRLRAEYDTKLRDELCLLAGQACLPAGTKGERDASLDHGTLIPLYFLERALYGSRREDQKPLRILRIGLSGLTLADHYRLGQLVTEAAEHLHRRIVWIASGDLSHKLLESGPYGYAKEGPVYDERIMDVMGSGSFTGLFDFDDAFCDAAAECGHRSFTEMAGALDGLSVTARKLSHEGPFGVGYGVCTFLAGSRDPERECLRIWQQRKEQEIREGRKREDPYVQLARASVESFVRQKRVLPLAEAGSRMPCGAVPPDMLKRRAGVFVSIHEQGRLRGCIGTISAVQDNIAEEIIHNGISASTQDPRFAPIEERELPYLEISVDVLGPAEHIASAAELDVKRYGVIVTKGSRRGLLLPNLEGVDTVERQIRIARQKAGIRDFEDGVSLERFEVVRHC